MALITEHNRRRTIFIIAVVASVARLYCLDSQSLWFDETFTVLVAQAPFQFGLEILFSDGVHPPLYYWIEKAALLLGRDETIVRLPGAIFGILAVILTYILGEKWIGRTGAALAALLLAVSPFHLWHSRDARMYSLLALFALICMAGYVKVLTRPSKWGCAWFTLSSALAYVTHYFALFFPLIQFIHLSIHLRQYSRQLRLWTGLQLLASLPLLGWIYLLSRRPEQVFGIGWIPPSGFADLGYTLINFTVGYYSPITPALWLVAAASLAFVVLGAARNWGLPPLRTLLILWAFLPPLLILLLSFRRPTYMDRFFLLSLPPFLLLLAAGVTRLKGRWAALTGGLLVAIFAWRSTFVLQPAEHLTKEDWRQAIAYLSSRVKGDEIVVLRLLQIQVPLLYYQSRDLTTRVMEVNRQVTPLSELVELYQGAWLVYWNASRDAHALAAQTQFDLAGEPDPQAAAWISGHGPPILERTDFNGITLFHFDIPYPIQ